MGHHRSLVGLRLTKSSFFLTEKEHWVVEFRHLVLHGTSKETLDHNNNWANILYKLHLCLLSLNINRHFLGTALSGLFLYGFELDYDADYIKYNRMCNLMCIALCQLIFTPTIVGYVWSIWWGVTLLQKSRLLIIWCNRKIVVKLLLKF